MCSFDHQVGQACMSYLRVEAWLHQVRACAPAHQPRLAPNGGDGNVGTRAGSPRHGRHAPRGALEA
ncbi:MAG: hypothetical protein KatS3mg054_0866 [Chloroflexus sp.]|nr:MAG: hypothetical protein KatS3mg054_0866 [Chloroflexus sp.]GIV92092.1 MAG: hypothetical protein KatS3mg056_0801 [Chloroflexus sp.]